LATSFLPVHRAPLNLLNHVSTKKCQTKTHDNTFHCKNSQNIWQQVLRFDFKTFTVTSFLTKTTVMPKQVGVFRVLTLMVYKVSVLKNFKNTRRCWPIISKHASNQKFRLPVQTRLVFSMKILRIRPAYVFSLPIYVVCNSDIYLGEFLQE
jgi:hypothetical protein